MFPQGERGAKGLQGEKGVKGQEGPPGVQVRRLGVQTCLENQCGCVHCVVQWFFFYLCVGSAWRGR